MASDPLDVALGAAVLAGRATRVTVRIGLTPARTLTRLPPLASPTARVIAAIEREGATARHATRAELDRIARQLLDTILADPLTEDAIVRVLESRLATAITDRVLASPELAKIVDSIATSDPVRDAITAHTGSLAGEVVGDVRRRSERADDTVERAVRRVLRRPRTSSTPPTTTADGAGQVTRTTTPRTAAG